MKTLTTAILIQWLLNTIWLVNVRLYQAKILLRMLTLMFLILMITKALKLLTKEHRIIIQDALVSQPSKSKFLVLKVKMIFKMFKYLKLKTYATLFLDSHINQAAKLAN